MLAGLGRVAGHDELLDCGQIINLDLAGVLFALEFFEQLSARFLRVVVNLLVVELLTDILNNKGI